VAIGSRCCSPSSRDFAKSASRGCTGIRPCYVAAGPVALSATSSSIIVASLAEEFHFSKHGLGFVNRAVLSRPAHQLLLLKRPIPPSLSARDLRPPFRFLPDSSLAASVFCTSRSICFRASDFLRQRIFQRKFRDHRSVHLAQNKSRAGFDADPSCLVL